MWRIVVLLALVTTSWAQPAFEAASVKPAPPGKRDEGRQPVVFSPGHLVIRDTSLAAVIALAYNVRPYQLTGPEWMNRERYDVVANASGPAPESELRQMLQGLLAERFQLHLHREPKNLPVYALVKGRSGGKLHASTGEGKPTLRGRGSEMVFEHYSMQSLAEFLSKVRGMDRPVVDQTGVPGEYDFTVEVLESPTGDGADAKRAMERATTDPSFGALVAGQIGLKLEPRSTPLELLVIDRLERATEN